MKGLQVGSAVLLIGAALGTLLGFSAILNLPNQFLSTVEGGQFEDNTKTIQRAIEDKCALHTGSSPESSTPRTAQFSAYRLDRVTLDQTQSSQQTNIVFESSSQRRELESPCDIEESTLSFDADANPAKSYEVEVSCQDCEQEPPALALSRREVD